MSPVTRPRNILRGILFMCASSAIFPVMNALVKHLSAELPTFEIVWARNVSHLVFVTLLFAPKLGWRLAATRRPGGQVLRSCFLLGSNIFYFTAMATVPLAEAAAITFISPFLVAFIAAVVLGERVGRAHWLAMAFGFLGALIVVRPGSGDLPWQAVFVLGSSLCYATYQVLTRGAAAEDSPETQVFYASMVGSVLTSLAVPFVWQAPESAWTVLKLGSLGVLGGLGHYCVARALMWGPAPVISPFQYLQLVAASLFGYFIFGDVPSLWTYVGAVIIIASGLSIAIRAHREDAAARQAAQEKPAS
jgi:drug/metabolite transporter (DMT)-like permease